MPLSGSSKPTKILVVDDEPDILEIVSYNLIKEGYSVKTAENGQDALKIAREFIPDLVLLDAVSYTHLTLPTNREV